MDERAWVHRPDRQIKFTVVASSRGRCWTGCEAYVYDASDGYSDELMLEHTISMYSSAPAFVTSRCDGTSIHRLQVPGDVKVVPAGYSRVWEISAPARKIVVCLTPAFVRGIAREMELDPDRVAIQPQLHLRDGRIEHIMSAFAAEVLRADDCSDRLYAEGLGTALAVQLLRRYGPAVQRRLGGLPKRRLERVTDYIREHVANPLSLEELAQVAHMSSSHFKVLFKQSLGMPVHQYVLNVRVQHALHLLADSRLPISQVALGAGFANQSHLARCLKKIHGTTPAEIRRQAQ